ncbi:hypothetical protein [Nocardia asiatica]|uniref:hypothetical protein n=1 Tax=Nocardia asiatica TaxID=209252 RepID=UPI003EE3D5B7
MAQPGGRADERRILRSLFDTFRDLGTTVMRQCVDETSAAVEWHRRGTFTQAHDPRGSLAVERVAERLWAVDSATAVQEGTTRIDASLAGFGDGQLTGRRSWHGELSDSGSYSWGCDGRGVLLSF